MVLGIVLPAIAADAPRATDTAPTDGAPAAAGETVAGATNSPVAADALPGNVETAASTNAAPTNAVVEALRDPFWPVGYEPAPEIPEDEIDRQQQEARLRAATRWPKLKLKGVTRSPQGYLAILEGIGLVEPGQKVSQRLGRLVYRWQIDDVSERGVQYRRLEAVPAEGAVP
jgi:hypothetical protein